MNQSAFTVLLFVLLHSFNAISMEAQEISKNEMDSVYQQAISHRNKSEKERAAELFLTLSYLGNPRAMHNYAMIKYDNKELDLAYHWFSIAAELGLSNSKDNLKKMRVDGYDPSTAERIHDDRKIDLHIVVGSNRDGHSLGPVFSRINDIKSSDNAHKNSFDGRATTMDLLPCKEAGFQHIVGDGESFSFAKYNIKSAYLERLPTFTDRTNLKSSRVDEIFTRANSTTGNIIDNLARSMEAGASLEIELHPYTMIITGVTREMREHFWATNPFHAVFDLSEMLRLPITVNRATEEMAQSDLTELREAKISRLINLYVKQGVHEDLIGIYAKHGGAKSNFELIKRRFNDEFRTITSLCANINRNMAQVQNLMENSIFGALMVDLAVDENTPHIVTYLERNGFANVAVERTTSPRNGRKNVWMVTATKS